MPDTRKNSRSTMCKSGVQSYAQHDGADDVKLNGIDETLASGDVRRGDGEEKRQNEEKETQQQQQQLLNSMSGPSTLSSESSPISSSSPPRSQYRPVVSSSQTSDAAKQNHVKDTQKTVQLQPPLQHHPSVTTSVRKATNSNANGNAEKKSPLRTGGGFVSINGSTTIGGTNHPRTKASISENNAATIQSRTLSPASLPFSTSSPPGVARSGLPINAVSFSQFLKSHQGGDTSSSGFIASSPGCSVNRIDTTATKNASNSTAAKSPQARQVNYASRVTGDGNTRPASSSDSEIAVNSKRVRREKKPKKASASARSKSREKKDQMKKSNKRKNPDPPPPRVEKPYEDELRDLIGILLSDMLEEEVNLQLKQSIETRAHHETSCLAHQFHNDVRKRANTLLGLPSTDPLPRDKLTPGQKALFQLSRRQQHFYDDAETDLESDDDSIQSIELAENMNHVDNLRKQVLSDWHAVRSKFERKWDWLDLRINHLQHELQETDSALEILAKRQSQEKQLELETSTAASTMNQQEQQQLALPLQQLQEQGRQPKRRIRRPRYFKLAYPPSQIKEDISKHMIFSHVQSQYPTTFQGRSQPTGAANEFTKGDVFKSLRMDHMGYVAHPKKSVSTPSKASRRPNLHVSVPESTSSAARLRPPRTPLTRKSSTRRSPSISTPRTSSRRRTPASSHLQKDYDINDIVVPWGVLRSGSAIEEVKPKEIYTPKWTVVGSTPPPSRAPLSPAQTLNEDVTTHRKSDEGRASEPVQVSSDEDTSDEFYCSIHFGMEYNERKRAYDFMMEPSSNTRKKKEVKKDVDKEEDARQRAQHIPTLLNVKRLFSVKRLRLEQNEDDDDGDNDAGADDSNTNGLMGEKQQSWHEDILSSPYASPISAGFRTPLSSPRSASKSRHGSHSKKKEPPRHLLLKVDTYVPHPFPEPYSTRGNYEEMREIVRLEERTRELEEQQQRIRTRYGKIFSEQYDRYQHQAISVADDDEFVFDFSDQDHEEYYDDSYQESDSDVDEFGESLLFETRTLHRRKRQRTESYQEEGKVEEDTEPSAWEVTQKAGPLKFVLRKLT